MTNKELTQEAYAQWEIDNKYHQQGINPEAYVLGYVAKMKKDCNVLDSTRTEIAKSVIQGLLSCPTFDWRKIGGNMIEAHIKLTIDITDDLITALNKTK